MEYNFREIEKKWQKRWVENKTYQVTEDETKKKFYVLNMFPYPSGAGLHVGHPLGYIASDIYARYKRLQGFNVLNPMGYDAYGLPAEQYAIQTGQHPAITTVNNINRYREQLDKIGFSFDWNREIRTCEPEYYHWTQWAFLKMFNSYYCNDKKQARPIQELIEAFSQTGTEGMNVACGEELSFTATEWNAKSEKEQQEILMNYRIAYLGETMVNWCPQLGTVLANDEVIDGVSERGGFPVIQKKMRQWCLRVSAYAQRLLDGLDTIDWTESLKETQKNWIGRSEGAEIQFKVKDSDLEFTIFTTRADTMFGVTFMVLAPESELVPQLTTDIQKDEVNAYLERTKKRTERERITDRSVTGVFSGSYALNPFTGEAVPIWISDYVLAGYGTGAIMAVPAHDSRDYAFAKHFGLEIRPLVEGCDVSEESFDAKEGIVCNSPREGVTPYCDLSLNGLTIKEAIAATKKYVKEHNLGRVKVNFRLRDAIFSRQRYWGEPFPVYYKDNMPYMIDESALPLELPEVAKFLPTETGEPPLGHATKWAWDIVNKCVVENEKIDNTTVFPLELNTMPGFAGSSAYYLRYMDPHNNQALVDKKVDEYWHNVDLYVGGTEHATGHLIYSRFWNKFLYDLGISVAEEPFQKLVNQGMIQGRSNFVYRIKDTNTFVSLNLKDQYDTTPLHVDVNIVSNDVLDLTFTDTGCGIEDEAKEKIFQRFYQSSKNQSSNGGSGIGLHIVSEYVKMHQGTVCVRDNQPCGSVFLITLPLHQNSNETKNGEPVEEPEIKEESHPFTILLVDDNYDFLKFLSESLARQYHVLKATNGKHALNVLEKEDIDLVVSDIMMPEMDGLELCSTIKNDIRYSHIPIILLTAKASEEHQLEGLSVGADDYITKPFNMEVLKLRINKIIEMNVKRQEIFNQDIKIEPSRITITPLDRQLVEKAIQIVEDNISETEFSVEELASSLNISRSYFYKKMIKITGKKPIEFIRTIRMKRAQQLLTESQMQVSEIAYTLGYNSPKVFSKHFKEEFNISPSEFIRQQAE